MEPVNATSLTTRLRETLANLGGVWVERVTGPTFTVHIRLDSNDLRESVASVLEKFESENPETNIYWNVREG